MNGVDAPAAASRAAATSTAAAATAISRLEKLARHVADWSRGIANPVDTSYSLGLPSGDEVLRVSEQGQAVSEREVEILELVAQGLTNGEIARRLWVTETTVKFHLSRVYRKLGVSNRTSAALWLRDREVEDPRS